MPVHPDLCSKLPEGTEIKDPSDEEFMSYTILGSISAALMQHARWNRHRDVGGLLAGVESDDNPKHVTINYFMATKIDAERETSSWPFFDSSEVVEFQNQLEKDQPRARIIGVFRSFNENLHAQQMNEGPGVLNGGNSRQQKNNSLSPFLTSFDISKLNDLSDQLKQNVCFVMLGATQNPWQSSWDLKGEDEELHPINQYMAVFGSCSNKNACVNVKWCIRPEIIVPPRTIKAYLELGKHMLRQLYSLYHAGLNQIRGSVDISDEEALRLEHQYKAKNTGIFLQFCQCWQEFIRGLECHNHNAQEDANALRPLNLQHDNAKGAGAGQQTQESSLDDLLDFCLGCNTNLRPKKAKITPSMFGTDQAEGDTQNIDDIEVVVDSDNEGGMLIEDQAASGLQPAQPTLGEENSASTSHLEGKQSRASDSAQQDKEPQQAFATRDASSDRDVSKEELETSGSPVFQPSRVIVQACGQEAPSSRAQNSSSRIADLPIPGEDVENCFESRKRMRSTKKTAQDVHGIENDDMRRRAEETSAVEADGHKGDPSPDEVSITGAEVLSSRKRTRSRVEIDSRPAIRPISAKGRTRSAVTAQSAATEDDDGVINID